MTLLELLVVLVLMGIGAAVVAPALRVPVSDEDGLDEVVTRARRLAVRRGEPLRLRVDADGTWAVVAARTGDVVDGGRIASAAPRDAAGTRLAVGIDALGSCRPEDAMSVQATAFDALHCRTGDPVPGGAAR